IITWHKVPDDAIDTRYAAIAPRILSQVGQVRDELAQKMAMQHMNNPRRMSEDVSKTPCYALFPQITRACLNLSLSRRIDCTKTVLVDPKSLTLLHAAYAFST